MANLEIIINNWIQAIDFKQIKAIYLKVVY
jgi:hypothetical protein